MDETNLTKGDLWRKRIQDFYKSGLLRKQWCQEHQVPLSTLGYWIRKQTRKPFINEQKTAALADVRVRQHGFCEWISGLDDSFSRRLARSLNLGICYAVKPSPINTCISQLIPE